jgi:uncharacterized repeat protein (TIGR03803 family)
VERGNFKDEFANCKYRDCIGNRDFGGRRAPLGPNPNLHTASHLHGIAERWCESLCRSVLGVAGNLYGTTELGGKLGFGTAFRLAGGGETVLHTFRGGIDGAFPYAAFVMDPKGDLYSTTTYGGGASGNGMVVKTNAKGHETALYRFCPKSDCSNGETPAGGLIMDSEGSFYGTTIYGGVAHGCGLYGCGTVFKVTNRGKETLLHRFAGDLDGANPWAGVVMDAKGNLYGTTVHGGPSNTGTVFEISKSGNETVLYSFTGGADGGHPYAGLVMDAKGNLYGTTFDGGASNAGTVFKLNRAGKETVLHSFGGSPDGANPYAGVVMDLVGNLYGTTTSGGAFNNAGTIFKVGKSGKEIVLYGFRGSDGANPYAGLVVDAKGNFYGTTYEGGDWGVGTVFELTP